MKTRSILFMLGSAVLLASCSTTMYVPNTVNAPLLKEKGEVKLNLDQSDLQVSYALTDHVGLMLNGFYKGHKGDNGYVHEGQLGEIGAGYFMPLGPKNVIFEAWGGVGIGTLRKQEEMMAPDNSMYTASLRAQGTRLFLQPGIGYASKYFDVALTPRFTFLKYTKFQSEYYTHSQLAADYLDNDQLLDGMHMFAEPAITVRGGYKFIKLQAQYGWALNLGGKNLRYDNTFGSIGVVLDLAKWYDAED